MGLMEVVSLLSGVALFLFGMSIMGDALKKVAGNKLEVILYKLSSNAFKGILLGTGVTAVIQSSSATSVMVVGFVNSGMMKVKQAIGIIMGAIIGTSITGWILCLNSIEGGGASIASYFNTTMLTGIVAVIGIILRMFCKKESLRYFGDILMGFAVLMFGMTAMSSAVSGLRESPEFIEFLTKFSNPILGILVGLLFTAVLQSASAAVGILQALAVTGAISFEVAFPIIMGIGIGASVPVLLSALGASANGKRTAFSYFFIDLFGAVICGVIFYVLEAIFHFSFMTATMTMVSIALVNTLFRFCAVLFLAPGISIMERFVCRIFPDDEDSRAEQEDMNRLEPRFLEHPVLALEQSNLVIHSMADNALKSLRRAMSLRNDYSSSVLKEVNSLEEMVDRYEDKLGTYLMKIIQQPLTNSQSHAASKYLHALSDFERISDHARNIGEAYDEVHNKKIKFSEEAISELDVLERAIDEIITITEDAFMNDNAEEAMRVEPLEEVIDNLCDAMKISHIERLKSNKCTLENGFVFNDLLTNYERVSDHCSNIAIAVIEVEKDDLNVHEYLENVRDAKETFFNLYYKEYQKKYQI